MDANGHELIRIRMGHGLTQGEALQFRIGVGPDLVSGRFGVSGAAEGAASRKVRPDNESIAALIGLGFVSIRGSTAVLWIIRDHSV
jgi:hypothetical protein